MTHFTSNFLLKLINKNTTVQDAQVGTLNNINRYVVNILVYVEINSNLH